MPRIYRCMKAENGKPLVDRSAVALGVRIGTDIDVDADGNVAPNTGGMSVSPSLYALPNHRVPERLRLLKEGARGPNNLHVWRMGEGTFEAAPLSEHLGLRPDSPEHGLVEPSRTMSLNAYENALAVTREEWIEDESGR